MRTQELAYELASKKEFERCVGKHWSFDEQSGKPLAKGTTPPAALSHAYYTKTQHTIRPSFTPPTPIGWCDGRIR